MLGVFAQSISVGAHAIGLMTHATPAMSNESLTEGYLTQPVIMASALAGPIGFTGMLNLEGLTLRRGELNAGVWGEGYSDRRHPHTYLHEAMLTYQASLGAGAISLSAGRGFAPFGTDDPMVRPFVKYPANHHLSQILERLGVAGAARWGPVVAEAGVFSGAEPVDPEDLGDVDKVGDSWSARLTLLPVSWVELEGSFAEVTSPENVFGGGLDHRMWHVSARASRMMGAHDVYGLVELGETAEGKGGRDFFFFNTFLAESAVRRGPWRVAARFERSQRPEEERKIDPFRTVRPATDNSIVGVTRWTSGTLQVAYFTEAGRFRLQPFIEIVRLHAESIEEFPVLSPETLYGSSELWSFSAGIRSVIGSWHTRMGRYGAARMTDHEHHH
jgi:hypothetical protein